MQVTALEPAVIVDQVLGSFEGLELRTPNDMQGFQTISFMFTSVTFLADSCRGDEARLTCVENGDRRTRTLARWTPNSKRAPALCSAPQLQQS